MLIFRERRTVFLTLKIVQFIFTVTTLAIELSQYAIYSNMKPDSPDYFNANIFVKGMIKVWNYTILSLSLVFLGICIYYFKRIWSKGPYIPLDISLAVLWLTSAIAELDPAYGHHPIQVCSSAQTTSLKTICSTWMAGAIFCWLNMLLFVMSAFVSWRIGQEKRQGIYSKPNVTPETKKRLSQRQSVLLKQGLENPDKSQPVMLESGIKPLMLVQLSKP